jgi:hypothetical protein
MVVGGVEGECIGLCDHVVWATTWVRKIPSDLDMAGAMTRSPIRVAGFIIECVSGKSSGLGKLEIISGGGLLGQTYLNGGSVPTPVGLLLRY